jgi:hypothetical protein
MNIMPASDPPAHAAVRVKLGSLAKNATEGDIRRMFKDFALCGSEVQLKNGYCFVWVASKADAQRAVTSSMGV